MKSITIIALLLCIVTAALADYTEGHNGRPTCTIDDEIKRPWRNNFDPTKYWLCAEKGEAVELQCPTSKGFMESEDVFGCVDWSEWQWVEPSDPPTLG